MTKSVIFNTASDAYQVSNIIYAGPISELPEERRKNGNTHSFRMITSLGAVYCYFQNQEAARKARGLLGAMIDGSKPIMFKSGYQCIDPRRIVSFGRVFALKRTDDGMTHGFVVNLETAQGKNSQVWLTYKSEDHTTKARKALYAIICAANRTDGEADEQAAAAEVEPVLAGGEKLPF